MHVRPQFRQSFEPIDDQDMQSRREGVSCAELQNRKRELMPAKYSMLTHNVGTQQAEEGRTIASYALR